MRNGGDGRGIFKRQSLLESPSDQATAEACLRLINDVNVKRGHDSDGSRRRGLGCNNGAIGGEYAELQQLRHTGGDTSTAHGSLADFARVGVCPSSPYAAVHLQQDSAQVTAGDVRKLAIMEEMVRTLRVIVDKREEEERRQRVAGEWRQVASVVDTMLFWVFFISTVVITLIMIVIVPLCRPTT